MKLYLKILMLLCLLFPAGVMAKKINATSYLSIVEALQHQVAKTPSVFPLEAFNGGIQTVEEGLRASYFGFGERKYPRRLDFHSAIDVAYFPVEIGSVITEDGGVQRVRAPQTYLKKVYAIQRGKLEAVLLKDSGHKIILKHSLEKPYYDNKGRPYQYYYTCYRHLDSRTIAHLDEVAKKVLDDPEATHKALEGEHVFEAGDHIGLVGFPPGKGEPRVHLDFSLNLFKDPDKGKNVRRYGLNPLLLFPPFEYQNPSAYEIGDSGLPAYQFVVDESTMVLPSEEKDGHFLLKIYSGGWKGKEYVVSKYYALNGLDVVLYNEGNYLGSCRVDRQRKLGYSTKSFLMMDQMNTEEPHFEALLGEQQDVFIMKVSLPAVWFKTMKYDWSNEGSILLNLSSIWSAPLGGHNHSFQISLPKVEVE